MDASLECWSRYSNAIKGGYEKSVPCVLCIYFVRSLQIKQSLTTIRVSQIEFHEAGAISAQRAFSLVMKPFELHLNLIIKNSSNSGLETIMQGV